jgi:hypothetical protein
MRIRSILGALVIASLPVAPVWAEMTPDEIKKMVDDAVEKRIQERERLGAPMERREGVAPPAAAPGQYPMATGPMTDIRVERKGEERVPLSFGATGSGKLVYAKPFLSAPKATVGGYADVMYNNLSRGNLDNPSRNSFGQQRLVPFIYADITDHIKFATEIEIERGGPNAAQTGDGSMQIEFAQIDYLIKEAINLRAGILLMPVGKFNLLHDSPLNDLVDRPMVSRIVIPSTWFEAGAGIYGTLYPSSLSKLDYELYVVNGLSQNNVGTNITDLGIRSARGSVSRDRDDSKAIVGRLAFSPMLGIEIAGSGYHGQYKQAAGTVGSGYIDMFAVDWTIQRGPFEIIGESAWTRISNNNNTAATPVPAGVGPAGMHGYYIQGNYHFMPDFLKKWAPGHFSDASTFTAVVRWEEVDTDTDDRTRGLAGGGNRRELERLTLGLNFRPIEDTVFKFDWQFNTQKNATGLIPGGDLIGSTNPINGNGFLIQAATYF